MLEVFSLSSCPLTSPLGLILTWHVRAQSWGHHEALSPFLLYCSFRVLRTAQHIPHLPHCLARTFCLTLVGFGRVAGSYQILCPVGREDQSKWILISSSRRSLNDELFGEALLLYRLFSITDTACCIKSFMNRLGCFSKPCCERGLCGGDFVPCLCGGSWS